MNYPLPESKDLELKRDIPDFQKLIKTCVAFANSVGGKIVLGVEDATLKIVGLKDAAIEHMMESFPQAVYQATIPPISVELIPQEMQGKNILNVVVPRGMRNIFCVKSEGKPKGVYVRVGRTTTRVSKETYEELMAFASFKYYDEQILNVPQEILSENLLRKVYGKKFSNELMVSEKIIGITHTDGERHPTIAAVLMFCENPEDFIPEALIKVTHFRGVEGRNIIATRDIRGPLTRIVEEAVELCLEWTEFNLKLAGVRLKGDFPVPGDALREAIINAVIHRKYSILGATKIAIFQDRLEIFSPGDIPSPLTLQNLGDGSTSLRNPLLAKLAHKARLIEKLGTGVRLIYERCRDQKLRDPEFRADGDFVKVIFYFVKKTESQRTTFELALDLLKSSAFITNSVLASRGIPRRTASAVLKRLVDEGYAKRVGELRGSKYFQI